MDPHTSLRGLVLSLRLEDYKAAEEHARDLVEWLGRGGFPPSWPGKVVLPDWLPRSSCLAILINKINEQLLIEIIE
jgi:hypothetical protein